MDIKPGLGLGSLRFGFYESLVTQILGRPDHAEEAEYVDGSGDWYRRLSYASLSAFFRFGKQDDFRLGNITIDGPGHTLLGRDIHGLAKASVLRFLGASAREIPRLEAHDTDAGYECVNYQRMGLMLSFHRGHLDEIQVGYLFEPDGETVIWPG